MKKIIPSFVVFLFLSQLVEAQTLDSTVVRRFGDGVIVNLLGIAKYTKLSPWQQTAIAQFYSNTDSTIKEWLLQGAGIADIENIQTKNDSLVFATLNKLQQAEYNKKRTERFANIAVGAELAFIKEEYKPDSISYTLMRRMLTDRYSNIYQRFLNSGTDDGDASEQIKEKLKYYDSYAVYPTLYSNKFISHYLKLIKDIKYIPDTTVQKIKGMFIHVTKTNKYIDWSKAIADIARFYIPDTAVFSKLQRTSFNTEAIHMSEVDRYNLIHIYHISSSYDSVYGLIRDKNYHNAVLQYTYAWTKPKLCDSLINKTTRYYDSAIEASLIRDGSLQPTTQFAIALKYRDWLKLPAGLTDSLVHHAMYVSRQLDSAMLLNPFVTLDMGAYESRILSGLLTEDQYTKLLSIRNRPQALVDANRDWAEIEERNLAFGLDKQRTIDQIANYYVANYSAWNRSAYDKDKQAANMRALMDTKPQPLKNLESARWNAQTTKANNTMKMQW